MWTPQQSNVIGQLPGHTVVFATPGSGKTSTMTAHVAHVLQTGRLQPREVCLVTFTRQAAADIYRRLLQHSGLASKHAMALRVGTFHAQVFRMLLQARQEVSVVMSPREQKLLMQSALQSAGVRDSGATEVRRWLQRLGLWKSIWPEPSGLSSTDRRVWAEYERLKSRHRRWDYDDILQAYCTFLHAPQGRLYDPGLRYLLVDEFQDTNPLQWQIVCELADRFDLPVFVVGDDDQAIYGFRGASPQWLLRFHTRMAGTKHHLLTVNFRSARRIVEHTQRLIRHNSARMAKPALIHRSDAGSVVCCRWADEEEEARQVAGMLQERAAHGVTQAVLARTRRQLTALGMRVHSSDLATLSVQLRTFHDAKGKEWDVVHLVGCIENNPYLAADGVPSDPEEERRLFYVAMTRARDSLFIHTPVRVAGRRAHPIRFIRESGLAGD